MQIRTRCGLILAISLFCPTFGAADAKPQGARVRSRAEGAGVFSAEQALVRAREASAANRYLDAARAYADALRADPNPRYFSSLVRSLRLSDDMQAAHDLLLGVLRDLPATQQADFTDFAEAREKILPELRAGALEQEADRLAAAQPGEAAAVYHVANQIRPRTRARRKEAEALRKAGRLTDALQAYEQTLRDANQQPLTPQQREEIEHAALQLRGQIARARGEQLLAATPKEAGRAFEEASQYQADPAILWQAAAAYQAAGDLGSAQRLLERLQLGAKDDALRRVRDKLAEVRALQTAAQAERMAQAGEAAGAASALRIALRDRNLPMLNLQLGRAYQQAGAPAEALGSYRSYLRDTADEAALAAPRREALIASQTMEELLRQRAALSRAEHPPLHRRTWFLAVCTVGALAVGAGVTAAVLLTRTTPEPATDLGIQGANLP